MSKFTESVVEDAALGWLEALGYVVLHLPAPPACSADRSLLERNRAVHRMPVCVRRACAAARQAGTRTGRLVDGVTVGEYPAALRLAAP